jgi:adenosylhomocysteine nucleosidase
MADLIVLAAMREELAALLDDARGQARIEQVARRECFVWRSRHGLDLVLCLAGIGKVAAATTATALIERYRPRALLFTGVAGGLHADVRVGDIVIASHALQHDLDASPLFPRYEVPLYGCDRFALDARLGGLLQHCAAAALPALASLPPVAALLGADARPRVHRGLVASGDRFVAAAAAAQALRAALPDALAVEMEGAAVAQVCHDYGLPCALLRAISDRADDSAHVDFLAFVRDVAARYGHALVDALLEQLASEGWAQAGAG